MHNLKNIAAIFRRLNIDFEDFNFKTAREVGEFQNRKIVGGVFPKKRKQVQQILRIANENQIPVYPFSKGKNWGLGSKNPPVDNCLLLDLSQLNRIRKLNLVDGFAIIEPGVTQYDLASKLVNSPFQVNVTGSTAATSILGNALERGVGYQRQRTDDLVGLEVLLGNGKIIKTGSYWSTDRPQFHYPHGIGPDLKSLFFQSNFGIVLSGVIDLIPKPEYSGLFIFSWKKGQEDFLFAKLKALSQNDFFNGITKVRVETGARFCFGHLAGKKAIVKNKIKLLGQIFKKFGPIKFIDSSKGNPISRENIFLNSFRGTPFSAGDWNLSDQDGGENYDKNTLTGFRFLMPILPYNQKAIKAVIKIINQVSKNEKVLLEYTFNLLSSKTIDLVLYLHFVRSPSGIKAVKKVQSFLMEKFYKKGFFPYRLDVDHFDAKKWYVEKNYINFLSALKKVSDPRGIISPGRYG